MGLVHVMPVMPHTEYEQENLHCADVRRVCTCPPVMCHTKASSWEACVAPVLRSSRSRAVATRTWERQSGNGVGEHVQLGRQRSPSLVLERGESNWE